MSSPLALVDVPNAAAVPPLLFADPSVTAWFLIDRLSGGGKMLRRAIVLMDDGTVVLCRPSNGAVRRLFHVTAITHLVHAPGSEGQPAGTFLLRIAQEHDVLFTLATSQRQPLPSSPPAASTPAQRPAVTGPTPGPRLLRLLLDMRARLATMAGAAPLQVAERDDAGPLRDAANVARPSTFAKPKALPTAASGGGAVFVPTVFDDFPIQAHGLGAAALITTAVEFTADPVFVTMLHRATKRHAAVSAAAPLVMVESDGAPGPFVSSAGSAAPTCTSVPAAFAVSSRFLNNFCYAYDKAMPLVVHVDATPLPALSTFRASERFWSHLQRTLGPAARALGGKPNIAAVPGGPPKVVVHVEVDEARAHTSPVLVATLAEWNAAVLQWDTTLRTSAGGTAIIEHRTHAQAATQRPFPAAAGRSSSDTSVLQPAAAADLPPSPGLGRGAGGVAPETMKSPGSVFGAVSPSEHHRPTSPVSTHVTGPAPLSAASGRTESFFWRAFVNELHGTEGPPSSGVTVPPGEARARSAQPYPHGVSQQEADLL